MKHLDLFSGIGGFALAARWTRIETVAFCEKDEFCQKVLSKNFPDVPIFEDIKTLKGDDIDGSVDLITGGFPCQPYSIAGRKKGTEDDRDLWPEMFRVIQELKPTWVIGENVANFVNMAFQRTKTDLESQGYEVQPLVIPACGVGAPHRRDRVWIVAYAKSVSSNGREHREYTEERDSERKVGRKGSSNVADTDCMRMEREGAKQQTAGACRESQAMADTNNQRLQGQRQEPSRIKEKYNNISNSCWWSAEPDVGRMAYGVPNRVDRLKGLGNAIVPQVAYQIMSKLKEVMG